ncbi:tetratricopeptide repeat protein [Phaeocystidibacter luteus]|uniref:tetratricopeptide repeat protein n=1 Tax=Phaeocystidibacter luteus TaxID=911197 RepID=UPI0014789F80|nr:tetratricopeptide repeat protein [Phaeocystidibacter luteus]
MKLSSVFILIFALSGVIAPAQEDTLEVRIPDAELSAETQYRFAQAFFEAQRLKSIGNEEEAFSAFMKCAEINPNHPTVNFELGNYYLNEGNTAKAKEYLNKALAVDDSNVWVARSLWEVSKREFDKSAEAEALRRLMRLDEANPEYIWEMAMVHLEMGEPDSAIAKMDRLEVLLGPNTALTDQKIRIYLDEGDYASAETLLKEAIQKFPNQSEYRGRLAEFYKQLGRKDEAIQVFQEILEINPNDPRAHMQVAEMLFTQNKVDSAQYHLRKAIGSKDLGIDPKVGVMGVFMQLADSRPSVLPFAFEMLDTIISVHPHDPKAYVLKADFSIRANRPMESRNLWRKATRLPGGDKWVVWQEILKTDAQLAWWDSLQVDAENVLELYPNQPGGYFFLAISHLERQQYDEAIAALEDGELYAMGSPELHQQFIMELARAHHLAGNYDESDDYFKQLVDRNQYDALARNNWAYYLALREEKLVFAMNLIDQAIELRPHEANFWDTKAWIYYRMKNDERAFEAIEKAIEYGGSSSPDIMEHRGDILSALGRMDEARSAWNRAIQLGGNADRIRQKLDALQ